ncbi:chemotaxis protein [Megalodesulfovibrio gigas]|uniref:Putative response regulator receiver modulated CheW protein n=1 Tax=Megalodesulfovibrio gigas (strain ATCC 19364 / DSM 1382 / NCIMB 9332 / VKM B-1759) TaxID=1121448 RepID=T2GA08_MEGG1|nr:chemotaxis protein [Megalodesulfovibrio gigas]AGW13435.1 putative response regulator receiver modulated CheW protein [Megalodesulfovibrio gigas DSM 1382 = ATCC 19364]
MSQTNILLESGTNELEIVEFYLTETLPNGKKYTGYYGINVAKVLEIIRVPKITEMPNQPHPSVLGAFNLRERIIPLVDLSQWLGKSKAGVEAEKVIVTEFNRVTNAFLVSGVTRIHRLSWEQIRPPSAQMLHFSGESITGVVNLEDRVLFILDMEKIVSELCPSLALQEMDPGDFTPPSPGQPQEDPGFFKVLIADDSGTIRNMMATNLAKLGFEVTATVDGAKAWEQLLSWKQTATDQQRPIHEYVQVIISDIEMPEMDGHSLTRRIKDDPVLKQTPVLLFSSLITESLRHKGEAVGADDQISKPDIKTLAERTRALGRRYMQSLRA